MPATASLKSSLNEALSYTYALLALTHEAHFNIEGSNFFQLHSAFGAQYEALLEAADLIGERLLAVGGYAALIKGLPEALAECPKEADTTQLAKAVLQGNENCLATIKHALDAATEAKDLATQNLLTDRVAWHEKTMWQLKAFLAD